MNHRVKETRVDIQKHFKCHQFGTEDKPNITEVFMFSEITKDVKTVWGKPKIRIHATSEITREETLVVYEAIKQALYQASVFEQNFSGVEIL